MRQRRALLLFAVGLSYAEIARQPGESLCTVEIAAARDADNPHRRRRDLPPRPSWRLAGRPAPGRGPKPSPRSARAGRVAGSSWGADPGPTGASAVRRGPRCSALLALLWTRWDAGRSRNEGVAGSSPAVGSGVSGPGGVRVSRICPESLHAISLGPSAWAPFHRRSSRRRAVMCSASSASTGSSGTRSTGPEPACKSRRSSAPRGRGVGARLPGTSAARWPSGGCARRSSRSARGRCRRWPGHVHRSGPPRRSGCAMSSTIVVVRRPPSAATASCCTSTSCRSLASSF
jgi:hypothetical protein